MLHKLFLTISLVLAIGAAERCLAYTSDYNVSFGPYIGGGTMSNGARVRHASGGFVYHAGLEAFGGMQKSETFGWVFACGSEVFCNLHSGEGFSSLPGKTGRGEFLWIGCCTYFKTASLALTLVLGSAYRCFASSRR